MTEEEPEVITGPELALRMGILPSQIHRDIRDTGRRPRIVVVPADAGLPSWQAVCDECQQVDVAHMEDVTIAAHKHNHQIHYGQGEVRPLVQIFPAHSSEGSLLRDAWVKFNRSVALVNELIALCLEWSGTVPLELVRTDAGDGWSRWSISQIRQPIPLELQLRLGEACHQLRSSLDVAMFAIAGRADYKGSFPVIFSQSRWKDAGKDLREMPAPVTAVVESWQPFIRRSDDPNVDALAILHELWNADKHRLIPATYGLLASGLVNFTSDPSSASIEHRVVAPTEAAPVGSEIPIFEARAVGAHPDAVIAADMGRINVRLIFTVDRPRRVQIAAMDLMDLVDRVRQILFELDAAASAPPPATLADGV